MRVERGAGDVFAVHFKPTGMGCMWLFLVVWLTGWTATCAFLAYNLVNQLFIGDWESIGLGALFLIAFGFFEVVALYYFAKIFLCRKELLFNDQHLVIETRILKWRGTQVIARTAINSVAQVKDGGEDEDSFPSFGLNLNTDRKIEVITRQEHVKSRWLGGLIAEWSGAPFNQAPED